MKNNHIKIGKIGEDLACEYLVDNDYKIIDRNFRKPWGEIDIIAKSKDQTLVFVEVKTIVYRQTSKNECLPVNIRISPEENLTKSKLIKLKRTCALYAGYNENLITDNKGWRIDLLAITIPREYSGFSVPNELTESYKNCVINHYENIA